MFVKFCELFQMTELVFVKFEFCELFQGTGLFCVHEVFEFCELFQGTELLCVCEVFEFCEKLQPHTKIKVKQKVQLLHCPD